MTSVTSDNLLQLCQAMGLLQQLVAQQGTADQREAWTLVFNRMERARLDDEDRAMSESVCLEHGVNMARQGDQDLAAGFDDLPFEACPESWAAKPFARIRWYQDDGDASVGMPGRSGWTLAPDQAGTVVEDLAKAGIGPAGGVHVLWTRTGGPVFLGGQSRLDMPFARITRFHAAQGRVREGWALAADQAGTMIEPLLALASVDVAPPPEPLQLLGDPDSPGWVVRALRSALDREPAQAAAEATVLARVLVARREAAARAEAQPRAAGPAQEWMAT